MRVAREDGVRVDLHLHSRASGTATNIWVQGLGDGVGVRESYTPPEKAYRAAKRAGMDFVTLTDHETIAGALTLVHPVYDLGGPLDRRGIEKRLVLFGLWEFINGSRPSRQNLLAREIAESVGAAELRQMALRHDLPAPDHARISGIGGSDDHGRAYVGAAWTVAAGVGTREEFLGALVAGEVYPGGEDGSVGKVTQAAFRLAGAAVEEGEGGQAAGFLRRISLPDGISRRLRRTVAPGPQGKLMRYPPLLAHADEATTRSLLTAGYEDRVAKAFKDSGGGFPALDFLGSIGGFMDEHVFIAPYLAVHAYFGRETNKARELRRELWPEPEAGPGGPPKIAMFVDGLEEIPGVATMYRNIQALDRGDTLRVVGCGVAAAPGVVNVRPISHLRVPLYEGPKLGVPSLLEVLEHVAEGEYDTLHVAAPGPLGLAALISELVLGIPVVGAYHTEFGAYARALSGDAMIAEIVEVAVRGFYERCSAVAVGSQAVEIALRNRGYRIQSFEILKDGVDADLFDPAKRDRTLREALGGGDKLLLYAGRLSREKGLERLAAGYSGLRGRRDDVHLVVAEDGPYRREMQSALGDLATFTGFLEGEELARLFASCDVFAFPSTTDTVGREETVREIVGRDLMAAAHCHRHRSHLLLSPRQTMYDTRRARSVVEEASGKEVRLFRPPYGVFNAASWTEAGRQGWRRVLWSRRGEEWRVGATVRSVVSEVGSPGAGDILLLHDSSRYGPGDAARVAVDALPRILDDIRDSGRGRSGSSWTPGGGRGSSGFGLDPRPQRLRHPLRRREPPPPVEPPAPALGKPQSSRGVRRGPELSRVGAGGRRPHVCLPDPHAPGQRRRPGPGSPVEPEAAARTRRPARDLRRPRHSPRQPGRADRLRRAGFHDPIAPPLAPDPRPLPAPRALAGLAAGRGRVVRPGPRGRRCEVRLRVGGRAQQGTRLRALLGRPAPAGRGGRGRRASTARSPWARSITSATSSPPSRPAEPA